MPRECPPSCLQEQDLYLSLWHQRWTQKLTTDEGYGNTNVRRSEGIWPVSPPLSKIIQSRDFMDVRSRYYTSSSFSLR